MIAKPTHVISLFLLTANCLLFSLSSSAQTYNESYYCEQTQNFLDPVCGEVSAPTPVNPGDTIIFTATCDDSAVYESWCGSKRLVEIDTSRAVGVSVDEVFYGGSTTQLTQTVTVSPSAAGYIDVTFYQPVQLWSWGWWIKGTREMYVNGSGPDTDGDGLVDVVDLDDDNDGMPDTWEISYGLNSLLDDANNDHDSDGLANLQEYQLGLYPNNADSDGDGDGDGVDNCPSMANADQLNTDGDSEGDVCDGDDDNDGVLDVDEPGQSTDPLNPDTDGDGYNDFDDVFPADPADWLDFDSDGIGDNTDTDDDNDLVEDDVDNCLWLANLDQLDNDVDGEGDACDSDDDNDGVGDVSDACPFDGLGSLSDFDGDGLCDDGSDLDDDNDLILDDVDNCRFVVNADQLNIDGDAEGDACDSDNDNDGSDDTEEVNAGTDPLDPSVRPYWWLSFYGEFSGYFYGEKLGESVSNAGDVNNDGYTDLIIGGGGREDHPGTARVYSGRDGVLLYEYGPTGDTVQFGASVSGAGDVDNDGYADFVVGDPAYDGPIDGMGAAHVYSGKTGLKLFTRYGESTRASEFGAVVSSAGDANGDGYADFMVGAPRGGATGAGYVKVYSGFDGLVLYTLDGEAFGDWFGKSLNNVGDINKDGRDDFIIGAPFNDTNVSQSGSAKVFSGSDGSVIYSYYGDSANQRLGGSVSGAGDINNDSYPDFVIDGAVYSGLDGQELYLFEEGIFKHGQTGGAGDINGDGYDDVIIRSNIYSGVNGDKIFELPQSDVVSSVSGVGDLDGDGLDDLVVGYSDYGGYRGVVRVLLSSDLHNDNDLDFIVNSADDDNDNDGMPNTWESTYGLDPFDANDASGDADGDGATNLQEYQNGFDPTVIDNDADADFINDLVDNCPGIGNNDQLDTDNDGQGNACDNDDDDDGMPDAWEVTYGLDPLNAGDANGDPDGDGLGNLDEYQNGTDPTVFNDADGDGIGDGNDNCVNASNASQANNDNDSLGDACDDDDDNDGMPDDWENTYGLNPLNANDTVGDSDGDSGTNLQEYQNGSSPIVFDDADGDGSSVFEEGYASTSDSDSDERPYWWRTFNGDDSGDYFGHSVSDAGDVNNDGYADIIVGVPNDDNNGNYSGSARVISGADGSTLYTFNGDDPSDYFGSAVSGAGDVNNDGYDDVIVGAYADDNGGTTSGSARVFSGVDGSVLYTFNGDSAYDEFGFRVSDAGDVNNDGYADLIVGARGDDNNVNSGGSARVFSGVDGSILYTFDGNVSYHEVGSSVGAAGDVNNDGYDDVIVASDRYYSDVWVYSGADGTALYTFNESVVIYESVSGAGDVNNDGYADFIIGAPFDDSNGTSSGSARVHSGFDGTLLYIFNGENAGDVFGWSVGGAGDVNADGYADLIVGTGHDGINDSSIRFAQIFSGADGSTLYTLHGDDAGDRFGYSVSTAGDVDNDGYADLVVGAPYDDNNGNVNSGSARVFLSSILQNDSDTDFIVNIADTDDDNDGIEDGVDNCPLANNPDQTDTDSDGLGDACDSDDDNDGVDDIDDAFPLDPTENTDSDLDGIGNNVDPDDDNDGTLDGDDAFPFDPAEDTDSDLDGVGNNADPDDDNDGFADGVDVFPLDALEWSDLDGDGIGDNSDPDPDGDGYYAADNCFWVHNPDQSDADGDGVGDACEVSDALSDTDGDYDSDIIWRNSNNGAMTIWEIENKSRINDFVIGGLGASYDLKDTIDLDSDGDTDLILFNEAEGKAIAWTMENNAKVSGSFLAGFPGYTIRGLGDVDSDGDGDIIWQAVSWGGVIIWIMEDGAKQSGAFIGSLGAGSVVEAIGDFDNDGDADLLWSVPGVDSLVRWDMENGGKSSGAAIGGFAGYSIAKVGDFNNDNTDDILWQPDGSGSSIIWLMQNGDKQSGLALGQVAGYTIATVGDYDGDGDDDILWSNASGHTRIWELENGVLVQGSDLDTMDAESDIRP